MEFEAVAIILTGLSFLFIYIYNSLPDEEGKDKGKRYWSGFKVALLGMSLLVALQAAFFAYTLTYNSLVNVIKTTGLALVFSLGIFFIYALYIIVKVKLINEVTEDLWEK